MFRFFLARRLTFLFASLFSVSTVAVASASSAEAPAPALPSVAAQAPVSFQVKTEGPFQFVAYGDIRFTDPSNHKDSDPAVRRALVAQIAKLDPKFVLVGGDLVLRGDNPANWAVWEQETKPWRDAKLRVFPVIGNHELFRDAQAGLRNYFQHFPELAWSRYYSVRAGNMLILVLDSSQPESTGPQGQWLTNQLDHLPKDVDFVFVALHHPPYTNSTEHWLSGGHSARPPEKALAKFLEDRQSGSRARFVVFAGHVHNYERYEHQGVIYIVSGGGGATPYSISRGPSDAYREPGPAYHYCLVSVNGPRAEISMMKLDMQEGRPVFRQADSVAITSSPVTAKAAR
jgi:hypothetical protein